MYPLHCGMLSVLDLQWGSAARYGRSAWRPSIKPHGRLALSHGGPRHLSGYATLLSGSQRLPSYLPLGVPSRPPLP